MADAANEEHTDLSKMKVPDLKKMLKARGLSILGNKQELIDRLHSSEAAAEALLEGSEVGDIIDEELDRELDETLDDEPSKETEAEVLDEPLKEKNKSVDPPAEEAKPEEVTVSKEVVPDTVKEEEKVVLKNGTSAEKDKPQVEKHKRITITDVSIDDMAARKKARLERFNQSNATEKAPAAVTDKATDKVEITTKLEKSEGGPDKLKKRAERFGILSPAEMKKQYLEKLQARKARFASNSSAPSTPATDASATPAADKTTAPPLPAIKTASSIEEKKRLRAERFKIKS